MGNIIRSFTSGFTGVISDLFTSPLDFLAGKSCSSVCGSTWDFICHIENFCIANLLKLAMVLALFYIVLLFLYLLYKLGIYECISHSLCKMTWEGLVCCFSLWEYCCIFFCDSLTMLKTRVMSHHRTRDYSSSGFDTSELEDYNNNYHEPTMEVISRSISRPRVRDHRTANYLRKYLRPRNHRIRVGYGYGRNQVEHGSILHNVRVIHSSKFVRKGSNSFRPMIYSGVRW